MAQWSWRGGDDADVTTHPSGAPAPRAPEPQPRVGSDTGAAAVTAEPPAPPGRWRRTGWPVAVYLGSRLLLLAVAAGVAVSTHHNLGAALTQWDGRWYLRLAAHGYPHLVRHGQSTLGFFPLYPLVIRGLSDLLSTPPLPTALVVSFLGGLVAAVELDRLAEPWWGHRTARRAVLAFCLFPGSVVFSMAYSECLAIPLVLGCLLALRSRRWLLAGLLAGAATGAEPVALVMIPVCAVAAARHLRLSRRRDGGGWRNRLAPLLAPALSPWGVGAFAVFLWAWTGTPFAYLTAQRYGWSQQADPLALLSPAVGNSLHHAGTLSRHLANFDLWNGLVGAVFLIVALVALVRLRREFGLEALVWAFGVGLFTLWSIRTPPNARMLLVAFPTVIVWARALPRRFAVFATVEMVLLLAMSVLTFAGGMTP